VQASQFVDPSAVRFDNPLIGTNEATSSDEVDQFDPPTLYVFNAASIAKPHAVEQLNAELIGYSVDAAIISESHLKKKHANSCVDIDNYVLFRRDRERRKGGGVAIYVRSSLKAEVYQLPIPGEDPNYELLWIKISRGSDMTFIGALYHPPVPIYQTKSLIEYIEATVLRMQLYHKHARIIVAGDLNQMSDVTSQFRFISASTTQGSSLGPASYVVTASDPHLVTRGNSMVKYADDTYLVVPADNANSCADEIVNVEKWAYTNNLSLNLKKSEETVFVSPWSK
jgi:Reverse transcriptase (RNA-dependent DNA polymerase)